MGKGERGAVVSTCMQASTFPPLRGVTTTSSPPTRATSAPPLRDTSQSSSFAYLMRGTISMHSACNGAPPLRDTSQFPNLSHHATISMQSSIIQDQRERAQSACNQPAIIQDQRESARVVVAIAVEVPLVACVARRVGGHEDGVRHLMRDVIDVQSACNHM